MTSAVEKANKTAEERLAARAQRPWHPYDPSWLADLARAQLPGEAWLPEALLRCTTGRVESDSGAYIHFVDPCCGTWEFKRNLHLASREHGWIVLDVLKEGRIGGVEFVDKIRA